MKTSVLLTVGLVAVLAQASAYGQGTELKVTGKIPFPFTVGRTALPAGQYDFVRETGEPVIRVLAGRKEVAVVPILTRLAGSMHTTPQDSHLVFDVAGNVHTLSEIWIPEDDGYMLASTKGEHQHKVVNIPR